MKLTNCYLHIVVIGLLSLTFLQGQSNNYYQGFSGDIINEKDYLKHKKSYQKMIDKMNDGSVMYEDLNLLYEKEDSAVYSYTFFTTYDLEETKESRTKFHSLAGKEFPIKSWTTIDGKTMTLEDLKGKPSIINFWFVGCAPCREEIPYFNEMKEVYGDRFNYVAFALDSKEQLNAFFEKQPFEFNQVSDAKPVAKELGVKSFPTSFYLDKDGKIAKVKGSMVSKVINGKKVPLSYTQFSDILESLE